MSFFDPYQLYKREQTNTHTGQVLRKKPPVKCGSPVTEEELARYIEILTDLGYNIRAPGIHHRIPVDYVQELDITHDLGAITYTADSGFISYNLATVWSECHNQFDMHLPFIALHNFQVFFAITYVQFYDVDLDDGNYAIRFGVRANDHYDEIYIGNTSRIPLRYLSMSGFSLTPCPGRNDLINVQTSNLYPVQYDNGFDTTTRNRHFSNDFPNYLQGISFEDEYMYNALKTENYFVLGGYPALFLWHYTGVNEANGIPVLHHVFRVNVKMKYSYYE